IRQRHVTRLADPGITMTTQPTGYLCLVLHCHLPYVRHPEHEHFLEENWLYEAITDTYIPLLRVLNGLVRDGVDFRLTATLSPPLISMLAHRRTAMAQYEEVYSRPPHGIWLPECGYYPGLDEVLRDVGLQFFFTESHGLLYADPRPRYGVHAPVFCPTGVAAFARDLDSSKQVWSAEEGYPGDPAYRDYYRDIGWDLDYDYIKPYIHVDGKRINTGIKYFRITGKTDQKQVYDRAWALERAADHAGNFMFNRERQVEWLAPVMDRPPIVVAPYDAELFGHWWFEGPEWLDFLFRKLHFDQQTVKPITPAEYLERHDVNQVCTPCGSSWGGKGYPEVWRNAGHEWIYRHLHTAARRMEELTRAFPQAEGLTRRALTQAGRELLLAQSSDWAFIMKTGTMVEYAVKRTKEHLTRFTSLYEQLRSGRVDAGFLKDLEEKDNLFPALDYRNFS